MATSRALETTEDVAVEVVLSGSDPSGGALVYAVTTEPQHGTLSGTAPNLTYTPDAHFLGRDTFSFTVTSEGRTSDEATVVIEVLNTPFYAITRGGSSGGVEVTSRLYLIDERGRLNLVGDTGHALVTIKVDPTSGTLFAVTRGGDVGTDPCHTCLMTLDPSTAAATLVAPIDLDGDPSTVEQPVPGIVFTSDGDLYGYSQDGSNFVVIDKTTGVATVPGVTGISAYAFGMWADENDVVWFINGDGDVYTIDPGTGVASPLYDGRDLAATAGIVRQGDFTVRGDRDPATGKYWGVSPGYGWIVAGGVVRLRIDAGTAEFIDIAQVEGTAGFHNIAFVR